MNAGFLGRLAERESGEGMRVAVIVVGCAMVLLTIPDSGWAQEPGSFDVAGGYSVLGDIELVDGFGLGWFAEGGWHTTRWLSLVGEVSRHRRTQDVGFIDFEVTLLTVLAGPRIRMPAPRFTPFVHLLAGTTRLGIVARTSIPIDSIGIDAATYGTLQIGGGIDVPLADRLALRVGADYRRVFTDAGLNEARVLTGAVYRF